MKKVIKILDDIKISDEELTVIGENFPRVKNVAERLSVNLKDLLVFETYKKIHSLNEEKLQSYGDKVSLVLLNEAAFRIQTENDQVYSQMSYMGFNNFNFDVVERVDNLRESYVNIKDLLDFRLNNIEQHMGEPNFSNYTIAFLTQLNLVRDLLSDTDRKSYNHKYGELLDKSRCSRV